MKASVKFFPQLFFSFYRTRITLKMLNLTLWRRAGSGRNEKLMHLCSSRRISIAISISASARTVTPSRAGTSFRYYQRGSLKLFFFFEMALKVKNVLTITHVYSRIRRSLHYTYIRVRCSLVSVNSLLYAQVPSAETLSTETLSIGVKLAVRHLIAS